MLPVIGRLVAVYIKWVLHNYTVSLYFLSTYLPLCIGLICPNTYVLTVPSLILQIVLLPP
jgi:hypothetical protein